MLRKVLAVGMLGAGFVVLIWGTIAETEILAGDAYRRALEPGVVIGAAAIIFGVLALGAYLLWPKSN